MNAKQAAEIANHCTEGTTGHLRKAQLVEAVKWWAMKASVKWSKARQEAMQDILESYQRLFSNH